MPEDRGRELTWRAVSLGVGALAGMATRRGLGALWRRGVGEEPPSTPAQPATPWPDALLWAASAGVAVGVARLVALRVAAGAWEVATSEPPPGLGADEG